jgi:hypothetical protein
MILENTMMFERKVIPVLSDMINENGFDILNYGLLSIIHAVQYKRLLAVIYRKFK